MYHGRFLVFVAGESARTHGARNRHVRRNVGVEQRLPGNNIGHQRHFED